MRKIVRMPSGASKSDIIPMNDYSFMGMIIPSNWSSADIYFEAGADSATMKPMYTEDKTLVAASVDKDTYVGMNTYRNALASADYLRICSGTPTSQTAQVGTPASATVDFGDDKVLTIKTGSGGPQANSCRIMFDMNDADSVVAVNPSDAEVIVYLADTTQAKNDATHIETAIKALGKLKDASVDMTNAVVTASAEYTDAPITYDKSTVTVVTEADLEGADKTLTFTTGRGGAYQGNIKVSIDVNADETDSDVLVVGATAAEDAEGLPFAHLSILLASTTATKNAASAIQTAIRNIAPLTIKEDGTRIPSDIIIDLSGMTVVGSAEYDAAPSILLDAPIVEVPLVKPPLPSVHTAAFSGGDDCWFEVSVKE
jgi:hypothetical protein